MVNNKMYETNITQNKSMPRYEVVKTYLSQKHFNDGLAISLSVLALCFLLSRFYWSHEFPWGEELKASAGAIFNEGEYWKLLTTTFIHGDFEHFLSNSLMLTIMGYYVSSFFGVFHFPFMAFLLGAVVNLLVLVGKPDQYSLVGASGVVYLLWGMWMSLYFLIQRHIHWNRRLMKLIAVGIFVLAPTTYKANISYLAHGLGFVIGITYGLCLFLVKRNYFQSFEVKREVTEAQEDDDFENVFEENGQDHG